MKPPKILIIDHREESRERLASILDNCQVETAENGKQGYALAKKMQPHIAVIDPMIPGVDGFTLSQHMRKLFPRMGIVISTDTYKGDRYQRDAKARYGASAYLEKPYDEAFFLETLQGLLPAGLAPLKKIDKRATLPAQRLSDLFDDATVQVDEGESEAHFQQLKDEFVMKDGKQVFNDDDFELDVTVGEDVPDIEKTVSDTGAPSDEPLGRVMEKVRTLEEQVNAAPFEEAAREFEEFERDVVAAANEQRQAFQPADTIVTQIPGDHRLTSEEIFGSLIDDIETGRAKNQPVGSKNLPPETKVDSTLPDQEPSFSDVGEATNPDQQPLPELLEPAPDRTDKYELLELIYEDQAFEVWKAKIKGEKGFQRVMALKRIKPYLADNMELNALFLREAKQAAALSHPNIVQIYELGEFDGSRFLAREFLSGQTLHSVLKICRERETSLSPGIVAHLGITIANALAYAHTVRDLEGNPMHIVHHHLSTDNIIISDEGEVKLMNFGTGQVTAKATGTDMIPLEQLQSLAPEQASGGALDHRVDIFALGSLMYRALTGLDPFSGTGRESIVEKISTAQVTHVQMIQPEVPATLADIISRCMARDPDERYQGAAEIAKDLRDFMKKAGMRIGDSDVAAYLRALSSSVVADHPVTTQGVPQKDARPDVELEPEFPSFQEIGQMETTPPPVRRVHSPVVAQAGAQSNTVKLLAGLILLLILVLAGLVVFKFGLIGGAKPVATVQHEETLEQPQPALDDPLPAEEDGPQPGDEVGLPEEMTAEPVNDLATETPLASPPAEQNAADGEVKSPSEEDLIRQREELRRKQELLKKLKKDN